ncbi:MAG: TonB-dependent receptor [Bacteriovoracaceae bacterium]|nr:TonB-dependent receptor [Bacteriovoracaceae bacterium]
MKKNLLLTGTLLISNLVFAETIIVTASRIPVPLEKTSSSVTVIGKDQIENSSATDLPSLLKRVSGVSISQTGARGSQSSVFLRGSNSSDYILMIDGIQMNDPSQIGRSASLEHISLDDIETIEVMKGSQSVIYGSDAAGGVIAITTKSANKKSLGGEFSASGGTGEHYSGRVALGGTINKTKYSVSTTASGENAQSSAKGENFDNDSQKYKNLNALVESEIFQDFTIKMQGSAYSNDVELDDGSSTDDRERTLFSKGITAGAELNFLYLDGDAEVKLSGDKSRFDRRDTDDSNPASFRGETGHLALQNNFYFSEQHAVAVGFEYEREEDLTSSTKLSKSTLFSKSAYTLYQLNNDSLFATVGIRVDHHSSFGKAYTYKIAPGHLIKSTGTKLFANYSTSFKAPSLYHLYESKSGTGNENLKPEKGYTSELGVSQSFLKSNTVELVAYYNKLSESIIYGSSSSYENGGVQKTKGIEAEYSFTSNKLNALINYGLNIARDNKGNALLKRPKYTGSGALTYHHSKIINLSLDFNYKGERKDYKNTTESYKLGGYTLFGISADHSPHKDLKLWVKVTNLFDKDYEDVKGYTSYGRSAKAGAKWSF